MKRECSTYRHWADTKLRYIRYEGNTRVEVPTGYCQAGLPVILPDVTHDLYGAGCRLKMHLGNFPVMIADSVCAAWKPEPESLSEATKAIAEAAYNGDVAAMEALVDWIIEHRS